MVRRAVVSQEEVPYDTDPWTGKPKTVTMDVLECGHKKRAFIPRGGWGGPKTRVEGQTSEVASATRNCHSCDREKAKEDATSNEG